jgi:hypothetical protein
MQDISKNISDMPVCAAYEVCYASSDATRHTILMHHTNEICMALQHVGGLRTRRALEEQHGGLSVSLVAVNMLIGQDSPFVCSCGCRHYNGLLW